jgi:hypothetical protein
MQQIEVLSSKRLRTLPLCMFQSWKAIDESACDSVTLISTSIRSKLNAVEGGECAANFYGYQTAFACVNAVGVSICMF